MPKFLEEPDPEHVDLDGDDASGDVNRSPTVVICSGELVEQAGVIPLIHT